MMYGNNADKKTKDKKKEEEEVVNGSATNETGKK